MKTTILIVDDSEIVLSVSRAILERAGYRVLTQNRAARCMSQIICERPALVLLDVNMPDLEGGGVVELCKRAQQVPGVSVVLYSGLDAKSLRRLVSMSGARSYIQKSDNAALLLRQVERLLGLGEETPLPTPTESRSNLQPHSGLRQKPAGETRHVLLVDRDMAALSSMRDMVRKMGHHCEFALSTKQAQEKLMAARAPDVIVVSDDMPQSGALSIFDSAISLLANFRHRFVFTTEGSSAPHCPPGFTGAVVKKPISEHSLKSALQGVLDAETSPLRGPAVGRVGTP
jgi:CheY-like chemotaxis protein